MSDREFERPGSVARPAPDHWPYHVPTPPEPPPNAIHAREKPPRKPESSPRRGTRLVVAVVLGVVAGMILGAVWVSGTVREPTEPPPVEITLATFPRALLGADRTDIPLREAGFGPTVERLDRDFAEQLAAYRFAYGGDGATLQYGRLLNLTIVNGILPPPLPRDGAVDFSGRARLTRRLVSLRGGDVSCTFEPEPAVIQETGMEGLGDLLSDGRTDCVLTDPLRNLSLRIENPVEARGADALDTAISFRDELRRLHDSLVG
ncbi:MAG: hypothetical protein ABIS84_00190 [Arachnia sp.]